MGEYEDEPDGGDGRVTQLASGVLPLLTLAPADDAASVGEMWISLADDNGVSVLDVRVEVADVQLLRRLHAANKLREADERFAAQQDGGSTASVLRLASAQISAPPATRQTSRQSAVDLSTLVGAPVMRSMESTRELEAAGEESGLGVEPTGGRVPAESARDMVDALRRHVGDEAIAYATEHSELSLSRFASNPEAAELSSLIPRLAAARLGVLDASYCLELGKTPTMLLRLLSTMSSLTSIDLMACNLGDDGATMVGTALGGALSGAPSLASLSLRANRIRADGAAALGDGAARSASLRRLDLSANPIGDVGLMRLVLGDAPSDGAAGGVDGGAAAGADGDAAAADAVGGEASAGVDEGEAASAVSFRRRGRRKRGVYTDPTEPVVHGLRYCLGLKRVFLSKVGLGVRALPSLGVLVASLDELEELDVSVNAFTGIDDYGIPPAFVEGADAEAEAATSEESPSSRPEPSLGRKKRVGGPLEAPSPAQLAERRARALEAMAHEVLISLGGGERSEWEWPAAMRALGRLCGSRRQLTKLAVQHTASRARVGYCVAMAAHPTAAVAPLQLINLQGTTLSEPALTELCHALRERGAAGPTEVNLEGCVRQRAAGALPALWQYLSAPTCVLATLNLGYNALTSGIELGRALAANAANGGLLIELDIGSNELGGDAAEGGLCALCKPLSPPTPQGGAPLAAAALAPSQQALGCRVRTLDLSYMPIGIKGAAALAAMLLGHQCALTALRLDGCELGADGIAALAVAIGDGARCAPLKSLRIEYNSLGALGMRALAAALPQRPTLRALFAGCNALGEAGVRSLASAVSVCAHIDTLDVGDNDLNERAVRALLEGVRSQYGLTALDLSNNRFGDAGAEALAAEIRTNPSLLFVRAAGNSIGQDGGAALAGACAESAVLLDITRNPAVVYADLTAVRLSNNRRTPGAPASPLDGWTKREE